MFGSPAAVYEALPNFLELYAPAFTMSTEQLGPNECRVEMRMVGTEQAFPELCAFGFGMTSTLPQLFGFSVADISHESCQCDGDPCCSARFRWDAAEGSEAEARRAEMKIRLLEARLAELQSTVAELGSGDGLQHVLSRVMAGATRAVEAPKFVLDIKASATSDRFIRTKGLVEAEGAAVTRALRESEADPARHVLVADVASERAHYGYLVAIRPELNSFDERERSVLESYARLAASALDSEAAVVEARRQAETAQALLALSSSLGDFTTSEEMAQHLASIIPSVIDCDRAIVSLALSASETTWAYATYGFDAPTATALRAIGTPTFTGSSDSWLYHHPVDAPAGGLSAALVATGSLAARSLGITLNGELFGWITVDVTAHPERLDDDVEITERLRGLAGQTAIAIHNARLLEEIRYPGAARQPDRAAQPGPDSGPGRPGDGPGPPGPRRHGACSSSTWTASRTSTTTWDTRSATICSARSRPASPARCASRTPSPAWAATSSSCWPRACRSPPGPSWWPNGSWRSWPSRSI